jgi:signal transduction histidine kinase
VSIRLRVAAVLTLMLAVAFALGSWLLVSQLSTVMLRSVDSGLTSQLAQAHRYLHAAPGGPAEAPAPGDYVVQVIDPAGRVVGASPEAGRTRTLAPAELASARRGTIAFTGTFDDDPERFAAQPYPGRTGWVAVAGVSLESYNATRSTVITGLAIGGSALIVLGALGGYALARAALAPVERLRREAATLSARDPSSRLPVPGTRDEIAALAKTMNELLGRLHSALARQRALVADASHELRTPFAVLRGELELAGKPGRSREELAAAVASAAEEAGRLNRITDDLLLLARSDEERLTLHVEDTCIRDLLTGSAEQARSRAAAAGASVEVSAPAVLTARVDRDRIRQAVDNLVDNALRFAPAGTTIGIAGRSADGDLVIEVTDTGPGFSADYLPHAFERFSRPDGGRSRSSGGAGLGLAIVQAIAAAHGGLAAASNGPDGGASVLLRLPHAVLSDRR